MEFEEFKKRGLLREFERVFTNEPLSRVLLDNIGFRLTNLPPFGPGFWTTVCRDIAHGAVVGGLEVLLAEAADQFPGNPQLAPFARRDGGTTTASAQMSPQIGPTTSIQFIECSDATALVAAVREAAAELRIDAAIGIGYAIDTTVSLHFDTSVEAALHIAQTATKRAESLGRTVAAHPFRDYLFERLNVEGPDQDRFELSHVPASTRAREIAKATMSQYDDAVWPRDKHGRARASVVDNVRPDGTAERLPPDQTLHDCQVRDGDTLHVSPEGTAGALHPRIREEALARVRTQVLDYAAGHPGFEVFANAVHAPTEYTFWFCAPGWGPPLEPGGEPVQVDEHEVFLSIPPEFPMKGPAAFWRSPRFHPNIDPETGFVCLVELQDGYRPGMDFGELCQLLVDLAAYQVYELTEGYDQAAAAWAGSPDGQMVIERRGGRSKLRQAFVEAMDGLGLVAAAPLRIQRVRS
jgi:hypothetical protein